MVNVFNSLDGPKIPRFRADSGIGTAARYQGTAARARYRAPGSGFSVDSGPVESHQGTAGRPGMLESSQIAWNRGPSPARQPFQFFRIVHRGPSPAVLRAKKRAVRFPQRPGTRAAIGPQGRLTQRYGAYCGCTGFQSSGRGSLFSCRDTVFSIAARFGHTWYITSKLITPRQFRLAVRSGCSGRWVKESAADRVYRFIARSLPVSGDIPA